MTTGQCYTREALEALLHFCNEYKIHLVSDEIYAYSVYETGSSLPGFTSVLSINTTGIIDSSYVHVLYGMSKDFAAAGLRLGCLISRNEELTKAARSLARFHWTSPLTDAIASTMLEDEEWHTQFLAESARSLGEHRRIATQALDEAGIPYNRSANAGFFLWIDLSACLPSPTWQAEDELKQKLYDHGVEMAAGRAYHDELVGKFRFIFSVDSDTLLEGLRRIVNFYQRSGSDRA
jgi:1-aminocyclopropane-1-carboxylate synthase